MVIGYIMNLRDKGKAHKTIQLHVAAMLHFFVTLNDIPLNKKKITRFIPPDESSHRDRPYTIDEVKAILESCPDERTKVIVELMASTAVRIGAISGLRICDLTPVYIAGHDLYKISLAVLPHELRMKDESLTKEMYENPSDPDSVLNVLMKKLQLYNDIEFTLSEPRNKILVGFMKIPVENRILITQIKNDTDEQMERVNKHLDALESIVK